MGKRKYHTKKINTALSDMHRGVQTFVETSDEIRENLDDIKCNTDELVKTNRAKLPLIIAFFGAAATIIGTIATIIGIIISNGKPAVETTANGSCTDTTAPAYEIYLYSDYKRLETGAETNITATLNFNTDFVSIDAYLNNVHNGDTIIMAQKNSSEWQAKVYFQETGIFEVIATATAPDGTTIKGTVEIEVVSVFE